MEKKLTIENTRGLVDPCVYMLTAPSGKIYVGSTIQGFHLRSATYRNEKAHGVINNALKKYRASNFGFSILESSKDWQKDKLIKREQYYLDTLQPFGNRGYNIESVVGVVTTPTRRVSQFTRAGEPVASYESITRAGFMSCAHAQSIYACCKGRVLSAGGYLWLYSKDVTPQGIERRVERAASGDRTQRRVSQYTKAGEFVKEYELPKQAARETGVNAGGITQCCKGKLPSAGGFLWIHSEEVTPQEIARRVEQAVSKVEKPVSQYTRAGVLVASYASVAQAAREGNTHAAHVGICCKGMVSSAREFLWLYSEEVTPQEIARRVEQAASNKLAKPVSQYTRAGVFVASYPSAAQAARVTGGYQSSISACRKGKRPSAGGFLWIHSEEVTPQEIARRVEQAADEKRTKPVSQYTRAGVFVASYPSACQAARDTDVNAGSITTCCKGKLKTAGGFIWKYT